MNGLETLRETLNQQVQELQSGPNLDKVMTPGFADRRLYAIYLIETYHYTRHNPRHQAAVVTRSEEIDPGYARFCLHHAAEEVGHERMAFHDLKAIGLAVEESTLPRPLASTNTLIAYLYRVAVHGHPLGRLGYSYWAERSYDYIRPLLELLCSGLGLQKGQMSFLDQHAKIDERHSREVDDVLRRFARLSEDWEAIQEVLINSLVLTARMMDEILAEFVRLKERRPSRYEFCNALLGL